MITLHRARFTILTNHPSSLDASTVEVDGVVSARGTLGIHLRGHTYADVTHIASQKRLGSFSTLGAALAFVTAIEDLADWSSAEPTVDAAVTAEIHRLAAAIDGPLPRVVS